MTKKEQIWLAEYLQCWNETEAARRAGYKWPNKQGAVKAKKFAPQIAEHIRQTQMSADEALLELGDIARLDMGDFLVFHEGVKEPYLDLAKAKEAGLLKLVKKIKYNQKGGMEIELYDKQAALVQIGKWQGLTEKQQVEQEGEIILKVIYDRTNNPSQETPSEAK